MTNKLSSLIAVLVFSIYTEVQASIHDMLERGRGHVCWYYDWGPPRFLPPK